MLWFAAWNVSLRDGTGVKSAIVPVPELDDWIAVLPDRLAEAATMQRAAIRRSRGALHLGERTEIGRHTSELQPLMRISYAVFCLKKTKQIPAQQQPTST